MHRRLLLLFFSFLSFASILHAQEEKPSTLTEDSSPKENWTTIYLDKSGLSPKAAQETLISKAESQGCTRELFRMQWRPSDPIDLYIIRPAGHEREKLPAVLFLHNYTANTDLFRKDRWCDAAKQNGFVVVGFGSVLSWQRFHSPRPMGQWFVSEFQEALAASTHDVQMILNSVGRRGDIDMQRIGIFGQGSGGAIAILAAAADSRLQALDLLDPWGDWRDWLAGSKQIPEEERPTYLKADFLQKVAGLDPVDYLPQLRDRKLRIHQVSTDPVTPAAAKEKLTQAASFAQVEHYADVAAEVEALGSDGIVTWFSKQLEKVSAEQGAH